MSTFFNHIDGNIKYISIIDRDNYPILSFNLSCEEEELSYQLMIFSSLDVFDFKKKLSPSKPTDQSTDLKRTETIKDSEPNTQIRKECVSLLMQFYEFDIDLGSFSYGGNNGIKIFIIKQMAKHESQENISKLNSIAKELHERFIVLLLNPFYDKREFYAEKSSLKESFSKELLIYITKNQIQ